MSLLTGKTALITGASAGIGLATAEVFAREGARLILTARRLERLDKLSQMLRNDHNAEILNLRLDVKNKKGVESAIDSLPAEWQNIDILVNNAGLGLGLDHIKDGSPDDWDDMIDTNVKGLLYVTRAVLKLMTPKQNGHIVNLGSIAGIEVYPGGNVYCATKFAVNAITKALRAELLDKNIRVTTIDPGMVETEFSIVRFKGDEQRAKNVYTGIDALTGTDIAETILFCVSRPAHVNINQVVIMPSQQASTAYVHRKQK
ncbi:MAG: SDR family oxidoreductase [Ignavibacteriaceae bacterium]|nr:SDR family oxidoreductase [Ignavibacteriaceae bacterium]